MRTHYAHALISLCFIALLAGCGNDAPKHEGQELIESSGCMSCHSLDGSKRIGPTFKGLYGKEIVVITQETKRTVLADRDYLKRSILDPRADVVEGFKSTMPTNYKQKLGEDKINTILDYLQTIGSE